MIRGAYNRVLALLGLAERRCAWCGALLGWIRGTRGQTSHGICKDCTLDVVSHEEASCAR